ncbi:glycine betaine ABC transporter substrate-binding protein [Salinibacterium hongtaonis]|uniref:Glycine/betaine ABC transporter substrate-binding protein n=1 Tax=Homoserinimonas hongtaonis TaxID=2079791 RepID=A0A2U1SZB1_9MICO|nr:glycine betaine ABC transporter substrate-binding protein [Salinibacterium hongtaonis]PWB96964.1 glycine/betaine ABC transporter substrate-binding protein [Salinibacterium hongtaonis]
MKNHLRNPLTKAAATVVVAGLALTGCTADTGSADDGKQLTIAVFNGWDEGIAVSELWKAVLENEGYDVTLEYADAAPVFNGLASADYDLTLDVWLPGTHAEYVKEYGDDIVELGAWNDDATLTVAVNEDAPIDSLAELAANADLFDNRIVGIEPGAGLTGAMEDSVIPGYGLDKLNFITSSTPAMLTELTAALDNNENIAVTLWRPHWAYDAFPIKDLEDPDGMLGGTESLYSYSRAGFESDFAEVATWISAFTMDSELLFSLENAMFNEYDGSDYGPVVAEWMAANQDYVDTLTAS